MLRDEEHRLKTTSSFESWDRLQTEVRNGFYFQFTRNMLHLNNGNGTFSDIGQMAGVARTDWSWSVLMADLDLDGYKDIYVTTGLAKDVTSQDYIAFLANRETMVEATSGGREFYQEEEPTRGFQSSVDYVLTFGVGQRDTLDSVKVEWPGRQGPVSLLTKVATNQRLTVRQSEAVVPRAPSPQPLTPLFTDVTEAIPLPYVHRENEFVDFDREPLIPKLLSTEGPMLAVAHVNGDGLDDMFIGGAKGQAGKLLIQQPNGRFASTNEKLFEQDRLSEDLGAVFFDADGDGHPDLYVVSGGSEFSSSRDPALQDRLYLNDGHGRFRKATGSVPPEDVSGSRVVAADYDGDGDVDLFVGGRVVPWHYGADPRSMLLQNHGHRRFNDLDRQRAVQLERDGMVTDALWRDVDGRCRPGLVVVGAV